MRKLLVALAALFMTSSTVSIGRASVMTLAYASERSPIVAERLSTMSAEQMLKSKGKHKHRKGGSRSKHRTHSSR